LTRLRICGPAGVGRIWGLPRRASKGRTGRRCGWRTVARLIGRGRGALEVTHRRDRAAGYSGDLSVRRSQWAPGTDSSRTGFPRPAGCVACCPGRPSRFLRIGWLRGSAGDMAVRGWARYDAGGSAHGYRTPPVGRAGPPDPWPATRAGGRDSRPGTASPWLTVGPAVNFLPGKPRAMHGGLGRREPGAGRRVGAGVCGPRHRWRVSERSGPGVGMAVVGGPEFTGGR